MIHLSENLLSLAVPPFGHPLALCRWSHVVHLSCQEVHKRSLMCLHFLISQSPQISFNPRLTDSSWPSAARSPLYLQRREIRKMNCRLNKNGKFLSSRCAVWSELELWTSGTPTVRLWGRAGVPLMVEGRPSQAPLTEILPRFKRSNTPQIKPGEFAIHPLQGSQPRRFFVSLQRK
jgi:hypothetical protein